MTTSSYGIEKHFCPQGSHGTHGFCWIWCSRDQCNHLILMNVVSRFRRGIDLHFRIKLVNMGSLEKFQSSYKSQPIKTQGQNWVNIS